MANEKRLTSNDRPGQLDFQWWQGPPPLEESLACVQKARSVPEIPIHEIPVAGRYPYRYCSAGPSQFENLSEQRKLRQCMNRIIHDKKIVQKFDVSNIRPLPQYETTTLMETIRPYKYNSSNQEIMKCHLPKAMLHPRFTRREIQSEFDEYIANQLYPYWKKDTKYKRHLVYKLQPIKREL